MFEKTVQEMFYKRATGPEELPWHSEKPARFLVEAASRRTSRGRALDLGCGAVATFTDLVRVVQDAVHGPRGTVINAFVEQRRVDLSGSLIDESWRIENVENTPAFGAGERTR